MSMNIHLRFPSGISTEPVVCNITRLFDLDFNIIKARISAWREGFLILELLGSEEQCRQAVEYLKDKGVEVTPVAQYISRDEDSCVDCGMCTAMCITSALRMDDARRLVFDRERCTVCLLCTKICPVKALKTDHELQSRMDG